MFAEHRFAMNHVGYQTFINKQIKTKLNAFACGMAWRGGVTLSHQNRAKKTERRTCLVRLQCDRRKAITDRKH